MKDEGKRMEEDKSDRPARLRDLTEKHVNDRHPHGKEWPSATEADQCENYKVRRVAINCFRAMKLSAQFPESAQTMRASRFFGVSA